MTQLNPPLVKPTALPGMELDRARWILSPHTNSTHSPEHVISARTNEVLTQTQSHRSPWAPGKKDFGY